MSEHAAIDARLEQALSTEFSSIDSDLFSEKVASRVSRMIYLRHVVLSIGWLTGLAIFFLMLPVLSTSLASMNSIWASWPYQELLFVLPQWFIPISIMLVIAVMPALLSRFNSRIN
ncbi:MAG: hypothetical protein CMK70_03785 [Pseudohongiella sp.]|nr:hypothetical protein [Pseudohongiella sp.]|tara:strand:- start:12784 stop:13131 length:348 start_codon:yes stop_codon:yes gene_type:complete